MKIISIALTLTTMIFISGCGITTSSLKSHPGYARLSTPNFWQADTQLNISLGPKLIKFAFNFIPDPELSQSIQMIKVDNELITGISVVTHNENKLVFVNIIGGIDPVFFEIVMKNFNVNLFKSPKFVTTGYTISRRVG